MSPETQKDLIRFLARRLRETMHLLYAYPATALELEKRGIPFAPTLQNAVNDSGIRAGVDKQMSGLEELIEKETDSDTERIEEFLRNWKPDGLPN